MKNTKLSIAIQRSKTPQKCLQGKRSHNNLISLKSLLNPKRLQKFLAYYHVILSFLGECAIETCGSDVSHPHPWGNIIVFIYARSRGIMARILQSNPYVQHVQKLIFHWQFVIFETLRFNFSVLTMFNFSVIKLFFSFFFYGWFSCLKWLIRKM